MYATLATVKRESTMSYLENKGSFAKTSNDHKTNVMKVIMLLQKITVTVKPEEIILRWHE